MTKLFQLKKKSWILLIVKYRFVLKEYKEIKKGNQLVAFKS